MSSLRLRVLCLHGRHQAAALFEDRLTKLRRSAIGAELNLVFVDGLAEVINENGDSLRGWRGQDGAWEPVEDALRNFWTELGPFDGVLGFSEGAQVAQLFCRLHCGATASSSSPCGCPSLIGLRFVIVAGGVPLENAQVEPLPYPSLHFMSAADPVVSLPSSQALAAAFREAQSVLHDGGHVFPLKEEQMSTLAAFVSRFRRSALEPLPDLPPGIWPCEEDQLMELEALESMFPEDGACVRMTGGFPIRLRLRFAPEAFLDVMMPPGYPSQCRCVAEVHTDRFEIETRASDLKEVLDKVHTEALGSPSVLMLVSAAQEWAATSPAALRCGAGGEAVCGVEEVDEEGLDEESEREVGWWRREEIDEDLLVAATKYAATAFQGRTPTARSAGAGGYGRPWQFVVGLVGKPSAGKSTFFNAVCQLASDRAAAMAPHPFTTIDPNVAPGWFAAACPSLSLGVVAEPEYGQAIGGRRRMPLLVKDVAGLVPGAYQGHGRGNAFLNDLVDADVLIHVVDASGRTDAQGVDQGSGAASQGAGGDPLADIDWVRREIHLWIFTNIRSKWDSVRKYGRMLSYEGQRKLFDRLSGLMNGYRSTPGMVLEALDAAKLEVPGAFAFSEADVHRFVACFLRVRFPMLLALNKADHPSAASQIARVRAALGATEPSVACSARAEWQLLEWRRARVVDYIDGAAEAIARPEAKPDVVAMLSELQALVLTPMKSTGVLEAITAAVELRPPTVLCAVADFAGLEGLRGEGQKPFGMLSSAVLLRPQSTVEEAFSALQHGGLLSGELVRVEVLISRQPTIQHRVAKKEERLRSGAEVMRVATRKKTGWQKEHK